MRRASQAFSIQNPDGPGHIRIRANEPVPTSVVKKLGATSPLLLPADEADKPRSAKKATARKAAAKKA